MAIKGPLVIGTSTPIEVLQAGDTLGAAIHTSGPNVVLGRTTSGAGGHEEVPFSTLSLVTINAQTGTTYTLVLADAAKMVTLSNAAAITTTVPPNSSVAFPVGTSIDLAQIGAGQVTVAQGSGVTVNATPGLKFRAQYAGATIVKTGTDAWLLFGDLAA